MPYDRNFRQNLIDGHVYPEGYLDPEPNNLDEIRSRLVQPRPSLSPSAFTEEAHKKFIRATYHDRREKLGSETEVSFIEGHIGDAKCRSGGIAFSNLDHLTDGRLVPGHPDIYYGARPEQLNRQIRDELNGRIIPSTQHDLPMAPNFFLAAMGPDEPPAVAKRQACYNGALGARGIHSLQMYREPRPVYDNNAYTITSTYHDGYIRMWATHPAAPSNPGEPPNYYMTQLGTFVMDFSSGAFREGATAFRNARDWAKERRDEFIDAANKRKLDGDQAETPAVDAGSSVASSQDETHTTEPDFQR